MIENLIKELEEERARVNAAKKLEEDYRRLIMGIKSSNYTKETIEQHLDENMAETLGALFRATKNKEIDLNSEKGKTVWGDVFEYAEKNMSRRGISNIEAGLYIINHTEKKVFL